MVKQKYDQKKLTTYALILAAVSLVVTAVMTVVVLDEKRRLDVLYNQESNHYLEASYQTYRTTFCYENHIQPCDLDQIMKWNDAHPDNKLSLTAPQLQN